MYVNYPLELVNCCKVTPYFGCFFLGLRNHPNQVIPILAKKEKKEYSVKDAQNIRLSKRHKFYNNNVCPKIKQLKNVNY